MRYHVTIRYEHRRWGPQRWETDAKASSIRVAISRALAVFFGQGTARDRREAHRKIAVEAVRLGKV